jgi:hypothetical protein
VATASGVPYGIHADTGGGVDFLDQTKSVQRAHRVVGSTARTLATAPVGDLALSAGVGGRVFLSGKPTSMAALPSAVAHVSADPRADLSTDGGFAVVDTVTPGLHTDLASTAAKAADDVPADGQVDIHGTVTGTGRSLAFTASAASPGAASASGGTRSPALPKLPSPSSSKGDSSTADSAKTSAPTASAKAAPADSEASSTVDDGRYCSIARNDPATTALQPTPNQVEWAVDMAVRGDLTSGYLDQEGWRSSEGLGTSVNPQGMFALPPLNGGGQIPSQVLLGVLTQESNLWQATSHADPGEFGNPLIGNFYGTNIYPGTAGYDPNAIWTVNWSVSDCGYGIGQVTDGMRMAGHTKTGETALPAAQQRALALDYTVNIAYAARILAQKWNEIHTSSVTITINNDDPSRPENWFAALWDYNSGFNAPGAKSNWGLGWYNNPANPIYPAQRHPFLDGNTYSDAAHPQQWPYEEKVEGWAAWPIDTGHSYDDSGNQQSPSDPGYGSAGYAAAWWDSDLDRSSVKPPINTFCDTSNACDISDPPPCETEHSGDPDCDTPHWWNKSATWKTDCATTCGHGQIRYVTLRHEPGTPDPSPPPCDTSTLPSGTVVVDDVPTGTPEPRCPANTFTNRGTFSFVFPEDSHGQYEAREDLQQIGGGFDGHYWFSHARQPDNWGDLLETTGTWKPTSLPTHLYQVKAYMPYLGSKSKKAVYQIDDGQGHQYTRQVNQDSVTAGWLSIGYFEMSTGATVTLNNITNDGTSGDLDLAYDAVAFEPVQGTWEHHTFDAVSIFPSDINLDTTTPWLVDTPIRTRQTLYDWAHSVTDGGEKFDNSGTLTGLNNLPVCTGSDASSCIGSHVAAAAQSWGADVTAAGTNPNNSPSQADWMGFAVPEPPTTIDPDNSFTDDGSYKIKTHIDAQYVTGPDGKIVPGSEQLTDTDRTGDTHIAPFVIDFVKATVADYGQYGVTLPDLSFNATDGNEYGTTVSVANPMSTGSTPGQAYVDRVQNDGIDSSGTCLDTKIVSGGSIGYRNLDAQPTTDANMSAWVAKLKSLASQGVVPKEVADAGGDIYALFFEKGHLTDPSDLTGSFFNLAPPIWQDVSMAFCGDGTVKPTHATDDIDDTPTMGMVYQSYMPNLYLYLDGHEVNETGQPATGPVQKGNFDEFSNIPGATGGEGQNAYELCAVDLRGNGGNPWEIEATPENFPVGRPVEAEFCDGT